MIKSSKKEYKETVLNIIGSIFIIVGIAAVINAIYLKDYAGILWFCYSGLILLGISILKRNSYLLAAQLNIFAIPLVLWTVDFFSILINGQSLFGIVGYFFLKGPVIGKIISSQHLLTLPLSLYALHLIGLNKKDTWKLSFIEITALFIITFLITPEASNINCIYKACNNFMSSEFYVLNLFALSFSMILITAFFINLFFLKDREK